MGQTAGIVKGSKLTEQVRSRVTTREALLNAVDALMEERGWGACTLQDIVARAGLTTGAVYSTFGSRGALLAAALVRHSAEEAGLDPRCTDLRSAVTEYAQRHYRLNAGPQGRNRLDVQLDGIRVAGRDPVVAEALSSGFADLHARLVEQIATRAPSLSRASAEEATARLTAVLTGLTLQKVAYAAPVTEADAVDAALRAVELTP